MRTYTTHTVLKQCELHAQRAASETNKCTQFQKKPESHISAAQNVMKTLGTRRSPTSQPSPTLTIQCFYDKCINVSTSIYL